MFFKISLAEWSFHRQLEKGTLTHLNFPLKAKQEFDIDAVEYVNSFFKDKATDIPYLNALLQRCKDNNITNHLLMIDEEGALAHPDNATRKMAVENHYKWIDVASYLGCAMVRVNAFGEGSAEEVQKAGADGLNQLSEYAQKQNIAITVENHGGLTSNGEWLAHLMKLTNNTNVGTLPDLGNFCIRWEGSWSNCKEMYDRYKGVAELMPFAKSISAKTIDFDSNGNCVETDYARMMTIIKDAGFTGYMGIEYGGENWSEDEGVRKTKELLLRTVAAME